MTTYAPDQCDISVVLPVYNEKGHLRAEIDRIRAVLEALGGVESAGVAGDALTDHACVFVDENAHFFTYLQPASRPSVPHR